MGGRFGMTALVAGVMAAGLALLVLWLRLGSSPGGLGRGDLELAVTLGSVTAIIVLGVEWLAPRWLPSWRNAATALEPRGIAFNRFTGHARAAVSLAQAEARRLNHNYIGTEHLLLGMLRDAEGVGGQVMSAHGLELATVRKATDELLGRGDRPVVGEVGLSMRARAAIEAAYHASVRAGHDHVGTGHLLVGTLTAHDAVAVRLLEALGVDRTILVKDATDRAASEADEEPAARVASGSPYEESIGFSRAVRIGRSVLVSGTAPIWPDGSCDPDPRVQAARCIEIILEALAEAGGGPQHVVRTRMYITDASFAEDVGRAHRDAFGEARPAATMVVVSALLDPRWKVEIEADAVVH